MVQEQLGDNFCSSAWKLGILRTLVIGQPGQWASIGPRRSIIGTYICPGQDYMFILYTLCHVSCPGLFPQHGRYLSQAQLSKKALVKISRKEGYLTGSIGRACNSWPRGYEFKLHIGGRVHLKKKKKNSNRGRYSCCPVSSFLLLLVSLSLHSVKPKVQTEWNRGGKRKRAFTEHFEDEMVLMSPG